MEFGNLYLIAGIVYLVFYVWFQTGINRAKKSIDNDAVDVTGAEDNSYDEDYYQIQKDQLDIEK